MAMFIPNPIWPNGHLGDLPRQWQLSGHNPSVRHCRFVAAPAMKSGNHSLPSVKPSHIDPHGFHPILTQVVLGFFHHFMGMIGQTSVKPILSHMFLTIFWPFHGNCWTMSNPSLGDLLVTAPTAEASESIGALWRCNSSSMRRWCSRIASAGNLGKSAENVRHVWDVSKRIYDICLLAEDCWECIWGYSRCIYVCVCVHIYIYTIYTHT